MKHRINKSQRFLNLIVCAVTCILFVRTRLVGQIRTEWVSRYNGPDNQWDRAVEMVVDDNRNVYVTGESWNIETYYDITTVKYDSDGSELWAVSYSSSENDIPTDLVTDDVGNVYVTGYIEDQDSDYITLKYDSFGNEIWSVRYEGGNQGDRARAIGLDDDGNVFVTGESMAGYTAPHFLTIKYNSEGDRIWVVEEDMSNGSRARDLAVDNNGNVYVTGNKWLLWMSSDYSTIKYDSNGNVIWMDTYNGPDDSNDGAIAIVLDSLGYVYVTGRSRGVGTGGDYATIKYDNGGNKNWTVRYNSAANLYDSPNAIAVDGIGNVYVTGESIGDGTSYDYATVKYDANGNEKWVSRYNSPASDIDCALDLALDQSGNSYVTGYSWVEESDFDYTTIKYNPFGFELWVLRYNGPANSSDWCFDVFVDMDNYLYLTGGSYGIGTNSDFATCKIFQQTPRRRIPIEW